MRARGARSLLQLAMVGGLLVVLALLAALQNRWITQLAESERERLAASLESAGTRFCDDFDRELTRASQAFRFPDGIDDDAIPAALDERLARWRSSAPLPQLVAELLVVTRDPRGGATVSRLDERAGRLESVAWDQGLESVRLIFAARGPVPILDERLPGIIVPLREPQADDERRPPRHHVVVRLDREYIVTRLLPDAAARLFGAGGLAVAVVVRATDPPGEVIVAVGPPVTAEAGAATVLERRLFSLRFFPDLARAGDEAGDRQPAPPRPADDRRGGPGAPPPRRDDGRPAPRERTDGAAERPRRAGAEVGRWILEVRHPAGSLAAAVAMARRRNLAVSLAIVALLGVVGALLVVSTRRAQRLARQQLDFVAGVSHELRTPLTAMRSAGQNLADGIVDDPERVRRYGALVEREGRRLTEMVDRVLAFAGIRSGQQGYRMQAVEIALLLRAVLADSRWVLEERRFEVEVVLPDDLPTVRGDAAALRQAVSNLVDNAMKFGAPARWLSLTARAEAGPDGPRVAIAVSDRGPGIRRADLGRVFEPFFRSDGARDAGLPGSGLGLAVVRGIVAAHGGSVTAESAPDRGSTFTIRLPAAAREEGA